MIDETFRGVEARDEQSPRTPLRDPRPLGQRLLDTVGSRHAGAWTLLGLGITSVAFPAIADLLGVVAAIVFAALMFKRERLALRMPVQYGGTDFSDPIPKRRGFNKARGMWFLGNVHLASADNPRTELWRSAVDALAHTLVFGTTGSGKTETLLGFALNSLLTGGGVVYVDAKGAVKLVWQIASMAYKLGREDDLLVINYLTGADSASHDADVVQRRRSNTTNPFAFGSADSSAELLVGLMSTGDASGSKDSNSVFEQRAIGLVKAIMPALVELRNKGELQLGVTTIRDHIMDIAKVMELSRRTDLSEGSLAAVTKYLASLPGFDPRKPADKQAETVHDQYGYAKMYWTRALGALADTYGHIYFTSMGEVDMYDVVVNRRILVVVLPALEKSGDELQNLGKIVLSSLRIALSSGLGPGSPEGDRQEVLESLPTASNVPTHVIMDEYGYMAVKGFAVTAAQGRGLGVACVFAGQDIAGFQRGDSKEADQVIANTTTKVAMKLEDATTYELFAKLADSAYVAKMDRMGVKSALGSYQDEGTASYEKRDRMSLRDVKGQGTGEAHILHGDSLVRADLFYANPPLADRLVLNRFLKVAPARREELEASDVDINAMQGKFAEFASAKSAGKAPDGDVGMALRGYRYRPGDKIQTIERALRACEVYHRAAVVQVGEWGSVGADQEGSDDVPLPVMDEMPRIPDEAHNDASQAAAAPAAAPTQAARVVDDDEEFNGAQQPEIDHHDEDPEPDVPPPLFLSAVDERNPEAIGAGWVGRDVGLGTEARERLEHIAELAGERDPTEVVMAISRQVTRALEYPTDLQPKTRTKEADEEFERNHEGLLGMMREIGDAWPSVDGDNETAKKD